jgi:hypothetical protein
MREQQLREEHPEEARKKDHERYMRHREEKLAYAKLYRQTHKEYYKEYHKKYQKNRRAAERECLVEEDDWRSSPTPRARLEGASPMRKRDELTEPSACMARARDDEMVFVLLGRDAAAPAAIRAWIRERIRLGRNAPDDWQLIEAERCARTMEAELLTPSPADGSEPDA